MRLVELHFGFLEGCGFRLEDGLGESGPWRTRVVYVSGERGIAVDYNVEFRRTQVSLLRISGVSRPSEPQVWVSDAPLDEILLANVLQARAPDRFEDSRQLEGLAAKQLELQLATDSGALREVASDFLEGSFAAMDDGERIIRQRIDQVPQALTVWLPEQATADAERKALDQARASVPPGVAVVAKRYGRVDS